MSELRVVIDEAMQSKLRELADRSHEPVETIVAKALKEHLDKRFWDETNAAYAALRANPQAWKEELEERALTENTLMDGLEDDE